MNAITKKIGAGVLSGLLHVSPASAEKIPAVLSAYEAPIPVLRTTGDCFNQNPECVKQMKQVEGLMAAIKAVNGQYIQSNPVSRCVPRPKGYQHTPKELEAIKKLDLPTDASYPDGRKHINIYKQVLEEGGCRVDPYAESINNWTKQINQHLLNAEKANKKAYLQQKIESL